MNSGGDGKKAAAKLRPTEKLMRNRGIQKSRSGTAAYGETDAERRYTKKPQRNCGVWRFLEFQAEAFFFHQVVVHRIELVEESHFLVGHGKRLFQLGQNA